MSKEYGDTGQNVLGETTDGVIFREGDFWEGYGVDVGLKPTSENRGKDKHNY